VRSNALGVLLVLVLRLRHHKVHQPVVLTLFKVSGTQVSLPTSPLKMTQVQPSMVGMLAGNILLTV
jgi:hypothetical protein